MTNNVEFDYNKLRGRIREKLGTLDRFAEAIGISGTSLNERLMNRIPFTQPDIYKSAEILGIPDDKLTAYFFTQVVRKTEQ